jgi:ribonuclease-3
MARPLGKENEKMVMGKKERSSVTNRRGVLFSRLESDIGYRFSDRRLLVSALTHRSYIYESRKFGMRDNQRLEFLGDAVLSLVICDRLLAFFPESGEGELSRMRASLVDTDTLAAIAERINLGEVILLSRGEENTGGRSKKTVLADSFEALTAAVFLDGGLESAERFVDKLFAPLFSDRLGEEEFRDYKTRLQELSHSLRCRPPLYLLEDVAGPDHDPLFRVTVIVGNECFGKGTGKTRKEAEQRAAREGLRLLEEDALRSKGDG